jgi:hypothetical protein
MKRPFKKFVYLLALFIILAGCQNVKDGLTGNKKSNSDEFLVEKKNPLTLPPEYGDLPKPKSSEDEGEINEDNNLESILGKQSNKPRKKLETKQSSSSLEKSIIEKIRKN